MSLNPGSVTIDPSTGAVSASGYAAILYAQANGPTFDVDDRVAEIEAARVAAATSKRAWYQQYVATHVPFGANGVAEQQAILDTIATWRATYKASLIAARTVVAASCTEAAESLAAFITSATVTVEVPSTPTTAIGSLT